GRRRRPDRRTSTAPGCARPTPPGSTGGGEDSICPSCNQASHQSISTPYPTAVDAHNLSSRSTRPVPTYELDAATVVCFGAGRPARALPTLGGDWLWSYAPAL